MKTLQLKNLIKEAVREAIQDELKDILLEAIKSPKTIVNESTLPPVNISNKPTPTPNRDMKAKYENMMGALEDTKMSFTSQDAVPMNTMGADNKYHLLILITHQPLGLIFLLMVMLFLNLIIKLKML